MYIQWSTVKYSMVETGDSAEFTKCSAQCTEYSVQCNSEIQLKCTVYSVQLRCSMVDSAQFTVYSVQCTVYSVTVEYS